MGSKDTLERVKQAFKDKEQVYIHHNNELGDWVWAVGLVSDTGFWLDAFPTKKEAVEFCKKKKLPIKEYIRDNK